MKKLLSTFLLIGYGVLCWGQEEVLTKQDRKEILGYLKETKSNLVKKVKSMSVDQWNYKPAPDVWSVSEICEHIFKAEAVVLKRVTVEEREYKPSLMSDIDVKREEMIAFIVGRETKLNAPEPVAPKGSFTNPEAFISEFVKRRKKTAEFVKTLDAPIKAYYEKFGPIGEVNGYHWLMFISAHTIRHMKQLDEVLDNPSFPG